MFYFSNTGLIALPSVFLSGFDESLSVVQRNRAVIILNSNVLISKARGEPCFAIFLVHNIFLEIGLVWLRNLNRIGLAFKSMLLTLLWTVHCNDISLDSQMLILRSGQICSVYKLFLLQQLQFTFILKCLQLIVPYRAERISLSVLK